MSTTYQTEHVKNVSVVAEKTSVVSRQKLRILTVSTILVLIVSISYVNIVGQNKELIIPVLGATINSWDSKSYWHSPWGESKVHKGIDIFAPHKTEILSPITGFILSAGYSENG
ncbi:MAG: hypothetical protein WC622_13940, partial [Pedobacter sp.]|uniref:hypothetical protein n=1 Tax=Pedobacter sp. TaxID=1411316 RepID=UPI003567169D